MDIDTLKKDQKYARLAEAVGKAGGLIELNPMPDPLHNNDMVEVAIFTTRNSQRFGPACYFAMEDGLDVINEALRQMDVNGRLYLERPDLLVREFTDLTGVPYEVEKAREKARQYARMLLDLKHSIEKELK